MATATANGFGSLHLRHSRLRGTIDEVVAKFGAQITNRGLEIIYCPNISGDIGLLSGRTYNGFYMLDEGTEGYVPTPTAIQFPRIVEVHHTMVHGYPVSDGRLAMFGSPLEYYACPRATPADFDNTLRVLVEQSLYAGDAYTDPYPTCNWTGNVYKGSGGVGGVGISQTPPTSTTDHRLPIGYSRAPGTRIMQVNGNVTISNRRTSASDQYVEWLRAAGWTVTEIDDSLEDGIYRADD